MYVFLLNLKPAADDIVVSDFDINDSLVVYARTPAQARRLANAQAKAEGKIWENGKLTRCQTVTKMKDQRARVLCISSDNG